MSLPTAYSLCTGMWIEMAEAQLNYAFGQTDTLLEALNAGPGSKVTSVLSALSIPH